MAQEELCLDGEEWRDIPGLEGYYQASNLGRIRGLDRIVKNKTWTKHISGRIMSQILTKNGYCQVQITKNGKQAPRYVHRMVASAFLPNPDNLPEVDHIDCDPTNNNVDNLRWVTRFENCRHTLECGHHYDGTANLLNPVSKAKAMKKEAKPVIRSDGKRFESLASAARALGVSHASVSHALKSARFTCCGYQFIYA